MIVIITETDPRIAAQLCALFALQFPDATIQHAPTLDLAWHLCVAAPIGERVWVVLSLEYSDWHPFALDLRRCFPATYLMGVSHTALPRPGTVICDHVVDISPSLPNAYPDLVFVGTRGVAL